MQNCGLIDHFSPFDYIPVLSFVSLRSLRASLHSFVITLTSYYFYDMQLYFCTLALILIALFLFIHVFFSFSYPLREFFVYFIL